MHRTLYNFSRGGASATLDPACGRPWPKTLPRPLAGGNEVFSWWERTCADVMPSASSSLSFNPSIWYDISASSFSAYVQHSDQLPIRSICGRIRHQSTIACLGCFPENNVKYEIWHQCNVGLYNPTTLTAQNCKTWTTPVIEMMSVNSFKNHLEKRRSRKMDFSWTNLVPKSYGCTTSELMYEHYAVEVWRLGAAAPGEYLVSRFDHQATD